jgi:endonuclease/exonuclease/phosphatase family metal-dependent hydrolase
MKVVIRGNRIVRMSKQITPHLTTLPGSAVALGPAGFHSAIALPSPHTTTARGMFRQRRTIDCAYFAGPIQSKASRVFNDVNASDHYPLSFEVRFSQS